MSVQQLLHRTDTVTKTGSAITSEQSQKLIQTMLTMSFGCVAFLRGLFADDFFIDQQFVPSKFEKDYDPADAKSKNESIRVKTLVRGKSAQVDLFLDWIDKGAIDAIKRGYLKSLSFSIFLDEKNPQDLHEVYTFFFDYNDNNVKVDINNNEETISLLNSRKVLQQLMRRFIIITQSLDPLPEQKFMSMRILFNDSCPDNYQPPFFEDAVGHPTASIKVKDTIDSFSAGSLSTGFHNINLRVMTAPSPLTPGEPYKEVDPFAAPFNSVKPVVKNSLLKPSPKFLNEIPSQTTNMLRSFLESSQPQVKPTQVISSIRCECGSSEPIKDCYVVGCAMCGKQVHSFCYGIGKQLKQQLTCYSCRSKSLAGIQLHKNLKLLLNARKLYKILSKFGIPSSVSDLNIMMGFRDSSVETCEALTLGLAKGLLLIDDKPLKLKNADGPRSGSGYILVDCSNIYSSRRLVGKGKYGLTFVPGLRGPDAMELRLPSTKAKKLLFDDSLDKCLAIDSVLELVSINSEDYDEREDDIVDSSCFESSPTKLSFEVSDHFSNLNIESSQDILSSSNTLLGIDSKKRIPDSLMEDSVLKRDAYYTSQPIVNHPRWKKRKISIIKSDEPM